VARRKIQVAKLTFKGINWLPHLSLKNNLSISKLHYRARKNRFNALRPKKLEDNFILLVQSGNQIGRNLKQKNVSQFWLKLTTNVYLFQLSLAEHGLISQTSQQQPT